MLWFWFGLAWFSGLAAGVGGLIALIVRDQGGA